MRHRLLSSLVVVTVLLAGCGGDDDDASNEQEGSPVLDDRTPEQIVSDTELARSVNLTAADFPAGWEEREADPSDDEDDVQLNEDVEECLGLPEAMFNDEAVELSSPEFHKDDVDVSATVGVGPDEAYLAASFAPFLEPKFEQCFQEASKTAFERQAAADPDQSEGIQLTDIQIDAIDAPEVGDARVAFRLVVTVSAPDLGVDEFQLVSDYIAAREGRFFLSLTTTNLGGPADAEIQASLIEKLAERAAAAA